MDFLIKVEKIVAAEIFAYSQEEALVAGKVAIARKGICFTPRKFDQRPVMNTYGRLTE